MPIAAFNMKQAAQRIENWIQNGTKTFATVTGVHGIMESQYGVGVMRIHQAAGMCVPDGMPTMLIGRLYLTFRTTLILLTIMCSYQTLVTLKNN